jgi:hypothetical protein
MDRRAFLAALTAVDLTPDEFAALVGASRKTVHDWGGRYPVPYYARLTLYFLQERGGPHGLLGRPPAADTHPHPHP